MTRKSRVQVAFGRAVKTFRLKSGTSQERLAELTNLHRTYMGDVERGERNISLINMGKVAKGLGIPLSKLIRETEKLMAK